MAVRVVCGLWFLSPSLASLAEETAETKITFDEHIKPIFREHCTACHSEGDKASDLALDSYGGTLAGGSSGDVIAEGSASGSRLYALITHAEQPHMPPDEDPMAKNKLDLVKTWIEQGMPENSGSKIKRSGGAAAAMLGSVSLGKPEGPPPMPENLLRQPVLETERSAAISALAASPWAPLVAVGGQLQVALYHTATGELLGVIPFPEGEPQSLTFTRDGRQLLIGGGRHSHSGCAVLVDIKTGDRITKVGDELDTVLAADISPDKSRIAIAGPQKVIRIYDSVSRELVVEMKKHTDWIFSLRYSPDGILLASADRSNGLVVWEADSGRMYTEFTGHKEAIRGLDFRADSNVLASASMDGTVKLWDLVEMKEIKSWGAHGGGVTSVAFANDGSLATSGRDSQVKLWNGNGELQKEFKGLTEAALEVAITGDASAVVGGDWNGKVQLWQPANPEQPQLIAANPPSIESRIQAATAMLAAVQAEFEQVASTTAQATQAANSAAEEMATAKSTADGITAKLGAESTLKQTLVAESQTLDARIAELEQQLSDARAQRTSVAAKLTQTSSSLTELTVQSESAATSLTVASELNQRLAAAAAQQQVKQASIQAKLDEAKSVMEQALADKVAMEQKAETLRQVAQERVAAEAALAEKLAEIAQVEASKSSETEALSQQLSALKTQLAEMQAKVDQALTAQAAAQQQLESKRSEAAELQQKLETAQSAALDAKESLELFEQSYRKPQ